MGILPTINGEIAISASCSIEISADVCFISCWTLLAVGLK